MIIYHIIYMIIYIWLSYRSAGICIYLIFIYNMYTYIYNNIYIYIYDSAWLSYRSAVPCVGSISEQSNGPGSDTVSWPVCQSKHVWKWGQGQEIRQGRVRHLRTHGDQKLTHRQADTLHFGHAISVASASSCGPRSAARLSCKVQIKASISDLKCHEIHWLGSR